MSDFSHLWLIKMGPHKLAFMEPKILSDGFTCYLIGTELNKLCNLFYPSASHNSKLQPNFIPNLILTTYNKCKLAYWWLLSQDVYEILSRPAHIALCLTESVYILTFDSCYSFFLLKLTYCRSILVFFIFNRSKKSVNLSLSLSIVCGLCNIWETFFFQSGK